MMGYAIGILIGFGVLAAAVVWLILSATTASRTVRATVSLAAFLIVGALSFWIARPWAFIDNYELGYVYNRVDGRITVAPHTGYIARVPFFENVHMIDLRPRQVCINVGGNSNGSFSINQRVLNCKLVSFNPAGLNTFVAWHGRNDYEGETLNDLLKIYAYDPGGRTFPFLTVSDETRAVATGSTPIGAPVTQ
jgi:hypothetical protein